MQHSFEQVQRRAQAGIEADQALAMAVYLLSTAVYPKLTFNEIYDRLLQEFSNTTSSEQSEALQLNRMEKMLMAVSKATERIQTDQALLQKQMTDLQASQATQAQAMADANTRLQQIIDDLRANAGGGDAAAQEAALNAAADSLETQVLPGLKSVQTALEGETTSEQAVQGQTASSFSVNPQSFNVAPGGQQQLSASVPVNWGPCEQGSIDANGLYTAGDTAGGPYQIIATSVADGTTSSAFATVIAA